MATWIELEHRFRELEGAFGHARLDHQGGADGEYWRVAGIVTQEAELRFELYAQTAGRKLMELFPNDPEIRDAPNDATRWYRRLQRSPVYKHGHIAYAIDDTGNRGVITSGHIYNPVSASVTQCLKEAILNPENEKPSATVNIDVSGAGSRVNYGSIDNSSNTTTVTNIEIFENVRKTILNRAEGEQQALLLSRLKALEDSVSTPSYGERLKDFAQAAASHMSWITPCLTALVALLPS